MLLLLPSKAAGPRGGGGQVAAASPAFQSQLGIHALKAAELDRFSPVDEKFGSCNASSSPCSDSETLLAQAKPHSNLLI